MTLHKKIVLVHTHTHTHTHTEAQFFFCFNQKFQDQENLQINVTLAQKKGKMYALAILQLVLCTGTCLSCPFLPARRKKTVLYIIIINLVKTRCVLITLYTHSPHHTLVASKISQSCLQWADHLLLGPSPDRNRHVQTNQC